jgi:uncharacterized radical SAM superfamily protein
MTRVLLIPLLFAFLGCAKPLLRQEASSLAQSSKEAYSGVYGESRGVYENMTADSVIIVRVDTFTREKTVARYYGVAKTKTDTLTRFETVTETKFDTVYKEIKTMEKNDIGLFGKARLLSIGALLAAIAFGAFKIYRRRRL